MQNHKRIMKCNILCIILLLVSGINLDDFFCIGDNNNSLLRNNNNSRVLRVNVQPIYKIVIPSVGGPLPLTLSIPANAPEAGMWSSVSNWPIIAMHTAVLPDGRVVAYGARPNEAIQDGRVFVFWDPILGRGNQVFSIVSNVEKVDSFCSSGTLLSDGTFLIAGGASRKTGTNSTESSILNWKTGVTTRAKNLNVPRWYGTMTKLPDGRALITGGCKPFVINAYLDPILFASNVSSTPEIYTPGEGWKLISGAKSLDAFGAENNRYWYPRQWVTRVGTVFGISTDKMWELTSFDGNGAIRTLGDFKTKPNPVTRPNVGPTCTALMYDIGKILQVGGNGYFNGFNIASSGLATVIDINDIGRGNVLVNETAHMTHPRQWANSIVLPNGNVLVTGGTRRANKAGTDAVLPVEIWNPKTGTWIIGASAAVFRGYHSSVALLPNGAILSAGGGVPGPVTNFNSEIYFPSYFFKRTNGKVTLTNRPKIISVSKIALGYGSRMFIQLPSGTTISEVSLITLPSVTHSFDSNQRRLPLQFKPNNDGIEAVMPGSRNLAPPGYYYVTLINNFGVPSESVIVSIDAASPPLPQTNFVYTLGLKEITGPFNVEIQARFDDVTGYVWQKIFDYGNGAGLDNIWFGQISGSADIGLGIWKDGFETRVIAENAIIQGEIANWKVGVEKNGLMWIEKNGLRLAKVIGHVPSNRIRANKLLGKSNWIHDSDLRGTILGISVNNIGQTRDIALLNTPKQITGAFSMQVIVRFDNVQGLNWQRIIDFGNGPEKDNIVFGQLDNSNDMIFEIWKNGLFYRATASKVIVQEEVAEWFISCDKKGVMIIKKNRVEVARTQGSVPLNVKRLQTLIGQSNWFGNAPLDGIILGLSIINIM